VFLNNFSECIERVKKDVPFVPHVPKATKVLIVQTEVKGDRTVKICGKLHNIEHIEQKEQLFTTIFLSVYKQL